MDKTSIRNFAIWARKKLIAEITYKAGLYGISEKGINPELPASTSDLKLYDIGTKEPVKVEGVAISQRNALADVIRSKKKELGYKEAFNYIIEEVAYTWFNRLIAIRFMEVNEYLPSGVRVLSSEMEGKNEPDMVTNPFETDIEFTDNDKEKVLSLKDDELFRFLFIKQCNKLNEYLPELFEKMDNYTELLVPLSFTDTESVVYHLVHDISEDDFNVQKEGQVQIIGWLYQYYNTEPKEKVFTNLKKNVKISKENIPAATQLFTPDWIVRYMVENSLGRFWVDGHSDFDKSEWKYYLEEAEQEESVKAQLEEIRAEYKNISPEEIKFLDPCMGSGHILVYAFDVLMQIYLSQGYTERDAASKIVENNLYGMDIDKRAYQLSYFAVMMKGRASDRRFLTRDIKPNLCYFSEMGGINAENLDGKLKEFAEQFENADTYGSLLEVGSFDVDEISELINQFEETFDTQGYRDILLKMVSAYKILCQRYDVVTTNPPYMGGSGMDIRLADFVKKNYPDSKSDLFAVFIERCGNLAKKYYAMITQHAFMFLSSYEKLRQKLLTNTTINMAHLGARAFDEIGGEVVQTTAFINSINQIKGYTGTYVRLVDVNGENEKAEKYLSGEKRCFAIQSIFTKIPGSPVAYWASKKQLELFLNTPLLNYAISDGQNITGNNDIFLRNVWEVSNSSVGDKWILCARGGAFRKWYGNIEEVIDWSEAARDHYRSDKISRIVPEYIRFRKGISWSRIASSNIGFRMLSKTELFEKTGVSIFVKDESQYEYIIALLNSTITTHLIKLITQVITLQVRDVFSIPVIECKEKKNMISTVVNHNIIISKRDWDSFEISWNFDKHPLINGEICIEKALKKWCYECNERFNKLKANEEELNRIFIDIYGLQDELTPEEEDKDVTVRKADLQRDVKSFVSYAVGCMFGRYSLDVDGLAYAGGEWDETKYKTFIPDDDNCIPITDEEYFSDDIVTRFTKFVKVGEETLEENLDFIAKALGNKGGTSRQVIRNYFLTDFIKDHIKIYQKRPIYWMFDSGKQNGFKALVYMHRWNADTIGNVRVEYLHKIQRVYESEISRMQETIDNSTNSKEIANAEKRKDKLAKQLKEARDYDTNIAHLALARIDIDLDDGVKVNYEKVQTSPEGKKLDILVKI